MYTLTEFLLTLGILLGVCTFMLFFYFASIIIANALQACVDAIAKQVRLFKDNKNQK